MADNLVIVESPAKAKTIQNYLGKDTFLVKSSFGHIRDLQDNKLSVDVEKGFAPEYVIPADKKKVVADLKKAAVKLLKGEYGDTVNKILSAGSGSGANAADGIGGMIGDLLGGFLGGK
jgi:hypothetical protein